MTKHLSGLRDKMAARDEKRRRSKSSNSPNSLRFSVPQSKGGQRETAAQRKARLEARRNRQRNRKPN